MKKSSLAALTAAIVIGFGVFVALAQYQVIFVPFFTPAHIEFKGLEDQYPVNGSMSYGVSLKGYGSNCIAFEAEMLREDSSLDSGEKRVAYFSKIDDCRTVQISQGPYDYSREFFYTGAVVLGKPGEYRVKVQVLDEVTKAGFTAEKRFQVTG
jgi:hypothetical protein